jgi:anti-sigma-K factor RskA
MTEFEYDHATAEADLGVLVLGALDPAEREAVEAHVAECSSCAAIVAELAPLPGLLKRVDTTSLDLGAPPPEILERALAQIQAEDAAQAGSAGAVVTPIKSRKRGWFVAGASLAAAAAVAFGVLVFVNQTNTQPNKGVTASQVVAGTDKSTGVSARVVMAPATGGTSLSLSVSGVEQGERCQLVAIGRDGKRDVTSTWVVMYRYGVKINTGTSMKINQIKRLDITTPEGDVLLQMPVKA